MNDATRERIMSPEEIKQVEAALKVLNKVRLSVQRKAPALQVHWYLDAGDNLCLMGSPRGYQENRAEDIIHDGKLKASSGGDW